MVALLRRLNSIIEARVGDISVFNSGCTEGELGQVERTLQVDLPGDYKSLLRSVNGQPDDCELRFPPDQLRFLSVEGVLSLWRNHLQFQSDEFFDELTSDEKVRGTPFHPRRIPIAEYEDGGAYLWIDYIPGPAGRVGQIIFNFNEIDFAVLEDSVTDLFRRYVTILETGAASLAEAPPDYGDGYRFMVSDQYMDFAAYHDLRT
ncbi:SMI1/KNR4 family protein [Streptomyces malaysiensis subsp. malaysiensis]|uniref:SMI1/KNR4 family protein n=1 Tax=Streptomyces malaysiensis TaxID=92644 RepID=A0ABX6WGX0_STRMQ|nr:MULTISPECIES: SMI1/KNR4 family protein [Streptomyces]QPI60353.1 SMI1/KNR4 family protein [Streptomyces solisilvae]UHH22059.1 SMI1/KNR4 family protein [Streptomyces sp. HNM0561]